MDTAKKNRAVQRAAFTRAANDLEKLLGAEGESLEVEVGFDSLSRRYETLQVAEQTVYEMLLSEASEEDLSQDVENTEVYQKRYVKIRLQHERRQISLKGSKAPSENGSLKAQRKYKLPTIELRKFGDDIIDWLPFWSQFRKIHDDSEIDDADKIQYLRQSTVAGSRARRIVESFPAVSENYPKIVKSLQSRFGREDLQIEVSVRALLKIVISNVNSKTKANLAAIYDDLETQLRALETLGVTADKCAALLFPLVESCIPADLLRIWQRSRSPFESSLDEEGEETSVLRVNPLNELMEFLGREVENEQKLMLARDNFGLSTNSDIRPSKSRDAMTRQSTAAGLVNASVKCVFCSAVHDSDTCIEARQWSVNQRRERLRAANVCFNCLQRGHYSRICRKRVKCSLCHSRHNTLLCTREDSKRQSNESEIVSKQPEKQQALVAHQRCKVFLPTFYATLRGTKGDVQVRVLIDTGSQRSYVTKSAVKRIGLETKGEENIIHALFGGLNTAIKRHAKYDVLIIGKGYSCVIAALDEDCICSDVPCIEDGPWNAELVKLGIRLKEVDQEGPIEMLIGADYVGSLYTGACYALKCGLTAVETRLGWTIMGRAPGDDCEEAATTLITTLLTANAPIKQLWELDILGITDPCEKISKSEAEAAAKEFFSSTVRVDDEQRYEVRLPWTESHPPLASNYEIAKKRLVTIVRRLKSNGLFEDYDRVFMEWLNEGIIEVVPGDNVETIGHYLPHRPVVKESSLTTKVRPVFDASAPGDNGVSLNDCLEKGPSLIELIPAILLRFRERRIGLVSDIRKAFLQISVHESDRVFLKFLWINAKGEIVVLRHKRVVFGVNSSPFLLGATINFHLNRLLELNSENKEYCLIVENLRRNLYVDNCVTSVDSEEELKTFVNFATKAMAAGMFELRGWEHTQLDGTFSPSTLVAVLGLLWDIKGDTLRINGDWIGDLKTYFEKPVTKRRILATAQQVFDPIGFTCPVSLLPKLLLQESWKKGLSWDAVVDIDMELTFRRWLEHLPDLLKIELPRWVEVTADVDCSLHTFSDASAVAYSAVVFLRVVRDQQVTIRLLAAKSRVAPLKDITIPRLELLGATIAVRLHKLVRDSLPINAVSYFWSDSSTVISWIRRKEPWAVFVMNRVQEIRNLTPSNEWHHVPGAMNPADLPSRGCTAKQLVESRWWEGPSWLYGSPETWPKDVSQTNEEEIAKERKKGIVTTLLDHVDVDFWHLNHFSKFTKTVRMVAFRYCDLLIISNRAGINDMVP